MLSWPGPRHQPRHTSPERRTCESPCGGDFILAQNKNEINCLGGNREYERRFILLPTEPFLFWISRGPAECSKRSPNQINHGCPRNRGVRVQDQRTSTGRHATSLSRRASLCVKAYRNIPEEDSITPRRAQDLITGKGTEGTPPLLSVERSINGGSPPWGRWSPNTQSLPIRNWVYMYVYMYMYMYMHMSMYMYMYMHMCMYMYMYMHMYMYI